MSLCGVRKYPPIPANPGVAHCSLTFQQERVLYFCELEPNSSIWDINTCKRLTGKLELELFERAVELLMEGHQVLRTRITRGSDGPVQSFDQYTTAALRHIDISREARRNAGQALSQQISEICQTPISRWTYNDLLFQVVLLTLDVRDHVLLLRAHHIIADAASVDLLWRDLRHIYNRLARGLSGSLPPKAIQYSDYAIWQRRHFQAGQTREQEEYWLAQFRDAVPALDLPADSTPSSTLSFKGGLEIVEIPSELIAPFQQQSWKRRVLLFSSLFAAYLVLLQKICQQEDVTVGVLFSGRHYCPELQELAGFFVNMTAVRVNVSWDYTFDRFVDQVHEQVEAAYYMQDYPFERLVQKLGPRRGEGRVPLVRTMFNVVSNAEHEELFEGLDQEQWIDVATQTNAVQVDLIFDIHWSSAAAEIRIEHNTDIFRAGTVARLAKQYITLLEQLCSGWDVALKELELVDAEQKRQMVEVWNPVSTPYARDRCVHEVFEQCARSRPGDVAIMDGELAITYAEAERRSNGLAGKLGSCGVGPDAVVAIVGGRSAGMVLGQLGILKAGGAYLPISRNSPIRRIHELLHDAGPRALVLPDDFHEPVEFDGPVVRMAADGAACEDKPVRRAVPSSVACVIYTSGSTGTPKGVMLEHRGIVNLATNIDYLEIRPGDRILQTGAPGFDATTFEIWGALLNGLTLYLVEDEVLLDARALGEFLATHRISIMFMIPPLFNQLVDADATLFGPLRYLISGGDVLSMRHVEKARRANPFLTVINAYGPTENTTYSTCFPIRGTQQRTIPIGRPIPNSKAYVFDRDMKLSPIGAIGELYVAGDGLARGYLKQPALTAEKFIPNPFVPGERTYRTGDLVRRRPDGLLEFVGRADRQVKIRGCRIELGEIENRLLEHPSIKAAVVTSATGADGNKYLCAYYVAEPKIDAPELRQHLAGLLPAYMLPSYFCPLDRMPLTGSGKIDQRALPEPHPAAQPEVVRTPLRTPEEIAVGRIWEELLETSNIGAHDNFFEVGGHSLKASALAARLSEDFGIPVSLRMVFDSPTVAELAILVAKGTEKEYCHGDGG